jgi:predicted unusual protein kinase regulating ubiquinone biosynthesis (AarF/ABC1/UbiB family)
MSIDPFHDAPGARAVPASRLARMTGLGGMATRIAGGVAAEGLRQLVQGTRPRLGDLVLTPANARRLADELARMRGAAMKLGQLLSMDAGDLVPPDLAEVLARLRSDAAPMPGPQLKAALTAAWGEGWLRRFRHFDVRPLAAASIGQVHRAQTRDGRDLAIKVQYPGVRKSIDSDVGNVAALLRFSGLVPRGLDLAPLLEEARRQLRDEADYHREGQALARFGALLADRPAVLVPALHADLTTPAVLAMDFVASQPIETLADAPQDRRDRALTALFDLMFHELLVFRLMQTDPNFANYRWQPDSGRIVLLDFGATRAVPEAMAQGYSGLFRAGLARDRAGLDRAVRALGFIAPDTPPRVAEAILGMVEMGLAPLAEPGFFDFAGSDLALRMRDASLALTPDRDDLPLPPVDAMFLQRKFAGLYLLASRLRARVDLGALVAPLVADGQGLRG